VAHTCNPSHSGGGAQEDCGWKPAQANSFKTLSLKKKPSQKWAEWLRVKTLSSSPSTAKKKKEVVERLPSKHETLSSNPNTAKNKKACNEACFSVTDLRKTCYAKTLKRW
jgi:hypothetical protein